MVLPNHHSTIDNADRLTRHDSTGVGNQLDPISYKTKSKIQARTPDKPSQSRNLQNGSLHRKNESFHQATKLKYHKTQNSIDWSSLNSNNLDKFLGAGNVSAKSRSPKRSPKCGQPSEVAMEQLPAYHNQSSLTSELPKRIQSNVSNSGATNKGAQNSHGNAAQTIFKCNNRNQSLKPCLESIDEENKFKYASLNNSLVKNKSSSFT